MVHLPCKPGKLGTSNWVCELGTEEEPYIMMVYTIDGQLAQMNG